MISKSVYIVIICFFSASPLPLPRDCSKGIPLQQTIQDIIDKISTAGPDGTADLGDFVITQESVEESPDEPPQPQQDQEQPQDQMGAGDQVQYLQTQTPPPTPENASPQPPAPEPAAPAAPTQDLSSYSNSVNDPDMKELLNLHNSNRAKHGARPLTWDNNLAASSRRYGQKCYWGHSQAPGLGENLYVTTERAGIGRATSEAWYDKEIGLYSYARPAFSHEAGHFTQMIWTDTTAVGCAMVECPGSMMGWSRTAYYVVCQYTPPGNVEGQFAQKVPPLLSAY